MVASRQFFCHKVILAAQSKFFAKLFKEKVLFFYSSKTTALTLLKLPPYTLARCDLMTHMLPS
jgi:hypothetical protein